MICHYKLYKYPNIIHSNMTSIDLKYDGKRLIVHCDDDNDDGMDGNDYICWFSNSDIERYLLRPFWVKRGFVENADFYNWHQFATRQRFAKFY